MTQMITTVRDTARELRNGEFTANDISRLTGIKPPIVGWYLARIDEVKTTGKRVQRKAIDINIFRWVGP